MKPPSQTLYELADRLLAEDNYYRLLGVPPTATVDEIRTAHRQISCKFHPDTSEHPQAGEISAKLHKAYGTLKSKESRTAYDLIHKIDKTKCPTCKGSGKVSKQKGFAAKVKTTCPKCQGTGELK